MGEPTYFDIGLKGIVSDGPYKKLILSILREGTKIVQGQVISLYKLLQLVPIKAITIPTADVALQVLQLKITYVNRTHCSRLLIMITQVKAPMVGSCLHCSEKQLLVCSARRMMKPMVKRYQYKKLSRKAQSMDKQKKHYGQKFHKKKGAQNQSSDSGSVNDYP